MYVPVTERIASKRKPVVFGSHVTYLLANKPVMLSLS